MKIRVDSELWIIIRLDLLTPCGYRDNTGRRFGTGLVGLGYSSKSVSWR